MKYCEWVVREGWGESYWGHTPCKQGFNYLSKTSKVAYLKECYEKLNERMKLIEKENEE